jgi:hypothetical protein
MNTLHVVTPLTRLHHLREVSDSIVAARKILPVSWHVLPDTAKVDATRATELVMRYVWTARISPVHAGCCWGAKQNNHALSIVDNRKGWVHFMSDDTILHPSIPPVLASTEPDAILLFPQVGYDGTLLRGPVVPAVAQVDLSQFYVPRQWANDSTFNDAYESDWVYLDGLLKKGYPYRWVDSGAVCYFNACQPSLENHPFGQL